MLSKLSGLIQLAVNVGSDTHGVMSVLRPAIVAIAAFAIVVCCFVGFFLVAQAFAVPPVPICQSSGGLVLPGQTPMATLPPGPCVHDTP